MHHVCNKMSTTESLKLDNINNLCFALYKKMQNYNFLARFKPKKKIPWP